MTVRLDFATVTAKAGKQNPAYLPALFLSFYAVWRLHNIRDRPAYDYIYKTGAKITDSLTQCLLDEAVVALACYHNDPTYAATAKRNVGALMADVSKAPYTILFNSGTSSNLIWNAVRILRRVDAELKNSEGDYQGRERLILVHGNRVILHLVYQLVKSADVDLTSVIVDDSYITKYVVDNIGTVISKLQSTFASVFPDAYPANVFKNIGRIRLLIENMK